MRYTASRLSWAGSSPGLVLIASVGSLANSGGHALYAVLVVAPYFVSAVIVASVTIEIVLRLTWLIWGAVALTAVSAIVVLVAYALRLSGG